MKILRTLVIALSLGAVWPQSQAVPNVLGIRDSVCDQPIVFPESFERDTRRMQDDWYLKRYAAIDDKADTRHDREVSDNEIIRRLQAMPTVIEMPFNSVVRQYIDMYTGKRRQLVENMLGLSHYYMPIFEEALDRHGMPMELKYLPVIESALNPVAVSRAGATGLWQFMQPTATGQGLEVNSLVDERRDPYKATEAAVLYLKQLNETYGDWSLAIAAYNCGPGNVNKALRRAGGGKKDYWDIYPFLPAETRGYVPAFIAACYAMTYYASHDIAPALVRRPLVVDSVHVTHRVHFQQISDVMGISMDELRALNPQYRQDIIPGNIRPYPLVLPSLQAYAYIANEDSILNHDSERYAMRRVVEPATGASVQGSDSRGEYVDETTVKYHKVQRGETVASVARKYGITQAALREANGMGKKSVLKRGQSLKILTTTRRYLPKAEPVDSISTEPAPVDSLQPAPLEAVADTAAVDTAAAPQAAEVAKAMEAAKPKATPSPKPTPKPKAATSRPTTHKVRKGDSLYRLSKQYGVSVEAIKQANGMKNNDIRVDQMLKIPAKK